MDFELNRENRMIVNAVKDWIAKECPEESVREWDEAGGPPENIRTKFLALGFTGLCIPEAYDGDGPDYLGSALVTEVIASRYPALARAYGSMTFYGGGVFSELASEEQKKAFLPKFVNGQGGVGVLIAGLDSTEGEPQRFLPLVSGESRFAVSGSGRCVGPAGDGDIVLFPASAANRNNSEINTYCVTVNREGMQISSDETLGYKGNAGARVSFNDMAVGPADMLGNAGNEAWPRLLGFVRLELAAEAVGVARGSFEYAVKYAKQRVQFGRPIARFPAIRDMFVQNKCDIEAAAMLLYRAAAAADKGKDFAAEASRAYYVACRTARRTALDGLQILGGYGYTMEFAAQRYVRDAVSLYNTGAESEGLKSVLSRQIGI